MYNLDPDIVKVLFQDVKKFMEYLCEKKLILEFTKDPQCKGYDDVNYFLILYINHLLKNKNGVKLLKTRLSTKISDEKKINKFIYQFLKLNYKAEKGMFSWYEASHFNIDFEKIKDTKTKYAI